VLVGCIGTLGKTGITVAPAAFNQQINAIVPGIACIPKWLLYGTQSPPFQRQMADNASATTVAIINKGRFSLLRLPVAPLPEQRRIVEAIESYLTRLDNAVALLKRVEQNLKRYRASVLKAAVEGRLVPTEAELARREGRSYEPASGLLARLPQNSRVRRGVRQGIEPNDAGASLLTPEGWAIASVADLLRAGVLLDVKDGNHGANHPRKDEFADEGLPFITAAQLGDFEIDYAGAPKVAGQPLAKLRVGFAESGDVILTHKGTVGRVAVCTQPCVLTPQTTYYRTNGVVLDAQYLAVHHASPAFQRQLDAVKSQTTRDFVPISKQYGLFVLVPPIGEQRRIGEIAVGHLSRIEHLRALLRAASVRGPRLRQSVLKWAFEGKLVEQDPSDEPASVLLERIRGQTARATK
jgi:type I restriction enzyme S subunit